MSETFFNQIIAELKEIRALLEQFIKLREEQSRREQTEFEDAINERLLRFERGY